MSDELSPEEAMELLGKSDELSLEEAQSLLAAAPQVRAKTRRFNTDDRTYSGWFKLEHTANRDCEVPSHDESERPRKRGMVAIIDDVAVCRVCYLAERDRN